MKNTFFTVFLFLFFYTAALARETAQNPAVTGAIISTITSNSFSEIKMEITYTPPKKTTGSKQKVKAEQINKATTHLFSDSLKVVQTLPGVVTGNDFSSLMYIRGGNSYETLGFIDNVLVANPYIWGGNQSIFNPSFIESVDFYSGGFPAKYPEALSGVLDVKNKEGNYEKTSGFFELSAATIEGFIQGPVEKYKSSYIFGVRRTQYDLFANAFSTNTNTIFPFFYDSQGKFTWEKDQFNKLSVNFLASYEGMDFELGEEISAGDFSGFFHYRATKIMPSFNWYHIIDDKLSLIYTFAYTDSPSDYKLSGTNFSFHSIGNERWLFGSQKAEYKTGIHDIEQGLGVFDLSLYVYYTSKYRTFMPDGTYIVHTSTTIYDWVPVTISVFYLQDDITLKQDLLNLNVGATISHLNRTDDTTFSPRSGLSLMITKDTTLKFNTGLYTKFPVNDSALFKNTEIKSEKTIHYVLGMEHNFLENYFVRLEFYLKDYHDKVVSDPQMSYTNNGVRRASGMDLFLQRKVSEKWDGWISYSYLNAEDKILERSDPALYGKSAFDYLEPVNDWFPFSGERKHNFSLVLNYDFSKKWKLATTYRYSTGTPYTPITGALYLNGNYVPQYAEYLSERTPDYHRFDVKLTMPGFTEKWETYIQFINAFGNKNIDQYAYNEDYSKRTEVNMLPFMFIGGLKYYF
ncbi:MAG: TonB-dependent receptor plug domain-containing protein [Elusimicrobiota bacterium]